jgi:chemosensory pili system protein ChpA (sensor histidine kinase/response regulator)
MTRLDPELIAGFYQEAIAYLPQVSTCLELLSANQENSEALQELYRLTHNLRSVTSAVGNGDALEVAQGAEELAEAIVSGAMPLDAEALELFGDAVRQLTVALNQPGGVSRKQAAPAAPPPAARVVQVVPPELVEGFLEEGRELLERSWNYFKALEASPGNREVLLEIRRAVHTLKGSAAMVGLRDISRLGHAMEDVLDELNAGQRAYDRSIQDLFARTLDAIAEGVAARGVMPAEASKIEAEYAALRGAPAAPEVVQTVATAVPAPAVPPVSTALPSPPDPAFSQYVRVSLDHLDSSLRGIGEFSVIRAGWDTQLAAHRRQLDELSLAIRRCQRIANRLETEYAVYAPGTTNFENGFESGRSEFDALEFDRYTEFHLLSRDLSETASDLVTIETQLSKHVAEFEGTRGRYAKASAELQDNILSMRMAPVANIASRLERTVRTTARTLGKEVELRIEGSATEIDKAALEALAPAIEHILRNAVSHGVEDVASRLDAGKPGQGVITFKASREGSNAVFHVRDDGAGIDAERVRSTAIRNGLLSAAQAAALQGKALYDLLFEPGFSTAASVNEISGRGVGLDIVRSSIESLKGTVSIESTPGQGTTFIVRLPLSQAILRVLFVEAAGQVFALPLANVLRAGKAVVIAASERIRQVAIEEALRLPTIVPGRGKRPAVVLDCGSEQIALLVSRIMEIREVLVRPPSGLLKKAPAVAGTTTLADGTVVLVLQPPKLLRARRNQSEIDARAGGPSAFAAAPQRAPLEILVIDDSVSVRRVVTNTLKKQGWNVTSAKDGLEALEVLHSMQRSPDAILVDVEMPRMDGYDFTVALRSEPQHRSTPVIMLTSRGGDKHRQKAFDVGVTDFLVKPYVEDTLVATIQSHAVA